ncbi:MAG TPA: redoxin domain-containing protein [Gemmatimonadaceae bacterium]|nr:redoxin domain-containing protein [Gemmatimonadaceae bacterium]
MEAYRDQYATTFNSGRDVVLMAISVDPDTTLASWARESDFQFLFLSDTGGAIGSLYGAYDTTRRTTDRSLIVIGPDGRIAHEMRPFRQMAQGAYDELAAVIDRLSPPRGER